jgi:hypothetical protein
MVILICYIAAVILCLLACFNVGHPRFSLGWAGVACLALGMALNMGAIH